MINIKHATSGQTPSRAPCSGEHPASGAARAMGLALVAYASGQFCTAPTQCRVTRRRNSTLLANAA
jgi:hypothetical protein